MVIIEYAYSIYSIIQLYIHIYVCIISVCMCRHKLSTHTYIYIYIYIYAVILHMLVVFIILFVVDKCTVVQRVTREIQKEYIYITKMQFPIEESCSNASQKWDLKLDLTKSLVQRMDPM